MCSLYFFWLFLMCGSWCDATWTEEDTGTPKITSCACGGNLIIVKTSSNALRLSPPGQGYVRPHDRAPPVLTQSQDTEAFVAGVSASTCPKHFGTECQLWHNFQQLVKAAFLRNLVGKMYLLNCWVCWDFWNFFVHSCNPGSAQLRSNCTKCSLGILRRTRQCVGKTGRRSECCCISWPDTDCQHKLCGS